MVALSLLPQHLPSVLRALGGPGLMGMHQNKTALNRPIWCMPGAPAVPCSFVLGHAHWCSQCEPIWATWCSFVSGHDHLVLSARANLGPPSALLLPCMPADPGPPSVLSMCQPSPPDAHLLLCTPAQPGCSVLLASANSGPPGALLFWCTPTWCSGQAPT